MTLFYSEPDDYIRSQSPQLISVIKNQSVKSRKKINVIKKINGQTSPPLPQTCLKNPPPRRLLSLYIRHMIYHNKPG